jgi:glycosyltransferase involved in cell wall biosynthesis
MRKDVSDVLAEEQADPAVSKIKNNTFNLNHKTHQELNRIIEEKDAYIKLLEKRCSEFESVARGVSSLRSWQFRQLMLFEPFSLKKIIKMGSLILAMLLKPPAQFISAKSKSLIRILKGTERVKKIKAQHWPKDRPLISIVMPSFNYGHFIDSAIESVLAQTFTDFELIIVDCSTEPDSIKKAQEINHPKIIVFFREGQHLLGDNRNFGIEKARGKYICTLDPDDKLLPTYLEKAVFLLETEALDIVSPSLQEFGEQSHTWRVHPHPSLDELLDCNRIAVVALFSKTLWRQAKGYHDYGMGAEHVHEDWDFWIRMAACGARIRGMQEPLLLYRKHSSSMSSQKQIPSLKEQRVKIAHFNQDFLSEKQRLKSEKRRNQKIQVSDGTKNLLPLNVKSPDKKSILIALPYLVVGGVEKRFLDICTYLVRFGYRITIVTTLPTNSHQGSTLELFQSITKDIFQLPNFLTSSEEYQRFLEYLVQSRNPEVLMLAGSSFTVELLPVLKRLSPSMKVIDNLYNTEGHLLLNRKFDQFIDCTVVENSVISETLISTFGATPSTIELVENGVDVKTYTPVLKDPLLNRKLVVSFIGRLSPEKAPDVFVHIAKECLKKNHNLKFILAGPGHLEAQMKHFVRANELENHIEIVGAICTKEYLAQTDILVVPSRIDGRPNIILEAFSMGIPVVASAVGGISDLINQSNAGILCEPENYKEFVDAVCNLASRLEYIEQLSVRARKYAEEKLDLDISNASLLKIIEEVTQPRASL